MPTMTVYFDKPFWVAVLEQHADDGTVRAVRHVFGAQPTDPELYEFLLRHGTALLRRADLAAPLLAGAPRVSRDKPTAAAPSDDAVAALREDLRQRRDEGRRAGRERRAAEAEERRAKARAKAKARHRGH
ncbi:DUF2992 family protein [Dactylosporangium salmoneum]|uniref:DUF2992 family protein n=1 Tax=Dactylosporangium salmoneum TaxID=53361 RepID=A0ABP5UBT1_9ACTN